MPFIQRRIDTKDYAKKIIRDYIELASQVNACRVLGARVVLTIGSWDMLHPGHVRYLVRAHEHGDLVIVGTDSDEAVRKYKGPNRPIIPLEERMEMLTYLSCIDFVTVVDDVDEFGQWQYKLLKLIRPDVFVAVEDSYPEEQREVIRMHSRELVVLPRQAENISSTLIIQKLIKGNRELVEKIMKELESEKSKVEA